MSLPGARPDLLQTVPDGGVDRNPAHLRHPQPAFTGGRDQRRQLDHRFDINCLPTDLHNPGGSALGALAPVPVSAFPGCGGDGPDADQPAAAGALAKQEDPVADGHRAVVPATPAESDGPVLVPMCELLGHLGFAVAHRIPCQQVGGTAHLLRGSLAWGRQPRGSPPPVPLAGRAVPSAPSEKLQPLGPEVLGRRAGLAGKLIERRVAAGQQSKGDQVAPPDLRHSGR